MKPPKFVQPLCDIEAPLGSCITFDVRVAGVPEPEITFYINGAEIRADYKEYVIVSEGNGLYQLIILDITLAHDAEYACQARNVAGEAWCYGELFVVPEGLCLASTVVSFVLSCVVYVSSVASW